MTVGALGKWRGEVVTGPTYIEDGACCLSNEADARSEKLWRTSAAPVAQKERERGKLTTRRPKYRSIERIEPSDLNWVEKTRIPGSSCRSCAPSPIKKKKTLRREREREKFLTYDLDWRRQSLQPRRRRRRFLRLSFFFLSVLASFQRKKRGSFIFCL